MQKAQLLAQLRAAKSAHIKWRSYAQALVAGVPLDENQVPVIHTDCSFGKWYYGEGQSLSRLPAYRAIEVPHEMLHAIYMQLFKLLFETEELGFFSKLVGASKRRQEKSAQIDSLLAKLVEMSRTLLEALEMLEKEVATMDDAAVAALA